MKELPQETFDKLWVGFQGIQEVLRGSEQLETEPFETVYQAFENRAREDGSQVRPS